jgi:hypothetical protein
MKTLVFITTRRVSEVFPRMIVNRNVEPASLARLAGVVGIV